MTAPTPSPRPARWRDIPLAAWILSRAFTNESRVGRRIHSRRLAQLHALAVTPFYLLIAIYSTVPGHLYLDPSRTGIAVAAPRRSLRSLAGGVAAIAFLVTVGVPLNLAARLEPGYVLELGAGVVATLSVALLLDAMIGRRHSRRDRKRLRPLRRKIPAGERWDLMMLAQLPDTEPAAARLARTLLRTIIPPGVVVTAVAHSAELHTKYMRHRFTPARGRQLFYIVPTRDPAP
ncbi:hypothetical protein [Brachybacterium vulturis]|uniref:hypothetical protein n=1 Tax=Brachybacterium vulturis TaxID=2017484 RepID=UPI003669F43E